MAGNLSCDPDNYRDHPAIKKPATDSYRGPQLHIIPNVMPQQ